MQMNLVQSLKNGPVEVNFIKADGSKRQMLATTNETLFKYDYKGGTVRETPGVIRAWDLLKGEWRSIREDRVISWQAN
jgi:hypothetical protein